MKIQEPSRIRTITLEEKEREILKQAWFILDELKDNMADNEILMVKHRACNYADEYESYDLEGHSTILMDLSESKEVYYEAFD